MPRLNIDCQYVTIMSQRGLKFKLNNRCYLIVSAKHHQYIVPTGMLLLFWWSLFIPSRNLNEIVTNNQMALISLGSCSRVKASMILTRADHLFIHNYVISLLNII